MNPAGFAAMSTAVNGGETFAGRSFYMLTHTSSRTRTSNAVSTNTPVIPAMPIPTATTRQAPS